MVKKKKKNIPELRFPGFEGEWAILEGENVFETYSNKEHNSDLPILAITQEFGAIPRDFIDYKIHVTDRSIETYKIVEKGYFIISLRSFQGGIEYSNYKGICSPAYIILRPIIKIDNNFFKFYFKTDKYIKLLNKKIEGIRDGKMISFKYFSEAKLIFPTLPEQEKIASFLSAVDERIQQLSKKKILLEQYKKGVMQQIFSQKLRFKDEKGKKYLGWQERKLNELLSESKERNYSMKYDKNNVLSVSGEYGVVNQIEFMGRSYAGKSVANYPVVDTGDIVYTKSPLKENPYGIIKFNKGRAGIVSTLYAVYSCNAFVSGEYLDYYFQINNNTNNYLRPLVHKGAKNDMKVNNSHVLTGKISIPCKNEQLRIVDFFNNIDKKIELVNTQLEKTKAWKKGLLQKMFV